MKKIKSVLIKLVLLGFLLSPFMLMYWFLTDPVHCIANLIGAWLWLIIVIVPLILVSVVLYGVFGLLVSIVRTIIE